MIAGILLCIVAPAAAFIATWIYFGYYYDEWQQQDKDCCAHCPCRVSVDDDD